jgi:hypothetical protein
VRLIQRSTLTAFTIALATSVSGCAVKWGRDGICLKPLFKVTLNRFEDDGSRTGGAMSGYDCNCVGGHEGGVIDGGVIDGGFVQGGPLTVETEPLGFPALPDGALAAQGFLSGQIAANPPPVFGPNYGKAAESTPSASTGNQQTAKKRPGSLNVSTGLPMTADGRRHDGVLRVGQRVVFGVYIENTGELPLDAFQLQGVFTTNLKPIEVHRSSGPNKDLMRVTTSSARIDGQRVIFERFDQLGADAKHEYQVTAEVISAGPGNFEVTQLEGPAVKKNTTVSAVAP